jgi:hypothetical protein
MLHEQVQQEEDSMHWPFGKILLVVCVLPLSKDVNFTHHVGFYISQVVNEGTQAALPAGATNTSEFYASYGDDQSAFGKPFLSLTSSF